jgi:hypothetical protein
MFVHENRLFSKIQNKYLENFKNIKFLYPSIFLYEELNQNFGHRIRYRLHFR